ncbi:MAG: peptidase T [Muricoprocola sp.]
MRAYERLLNYVKVYTTSDDESEATPSSQRQFDLGNQLAQELESLGAQNVRIDDTCYVYGEIPATPGMEEKPVIGFIAHMDTAPDFSGEGVCPQIIENYDGKDVKLGASGRILSVKDFPHLPDLAGRTLITTDGNTLLGADDKAGVAEIMTLAEELLKGGKPHGKICIAFTPDEEVGRGADHFDVPGFGAEFAYTVDGGAENEIEYENFNAAGVQVEIKGFSVHPGSSKDTMINASLVAMEFNNMLPTGDTPRDTEGYEGFFHLHDMSGDVCQAKLEYIVRDHSAEMFACRKEMMRHIAKLLNEKYGEGTVTLTIKEQYRNMKEKIEPCMHLIENAKKASEMAGCVPQTVPIRGGTDGARLSFMGLPCPNLGTGGYAFHGPYEHITAEGMDKAVEVLKNIVSLYAGEGV